MVSLYQSSIYRPILTIFVRSMAIGGAVYIYVGGYGEEIWGGKGGWGGKKEHPVGCYYLI